MGWGEAIRLTTVLSGDPSSQVAVALMKWEYPLSHAELILADLYDLQHMSKARRRPPARPRPWKKTGKRRIGDRAGRSREQIRQILNDHGHHFTI